ncbi:MAG: MotA/TolQ/ExbB proton channel family protein [Lentisphaerae bacterium]|nr:MotA/TolQ/ExbB proton channel family protein [Lentisphaerota bacterium]
MPLYLLSRGGALVWVIFGAGMVALGVFIERSLHLHRARIRAEDFMRGIKNNLIRGNISESLSICDGTPGPVAHVVKTAILHRSGGKDEIQKAMQEAALSETSRMERRLVVLATVAQIAPVLGLLGTVLGMLRSLLVIRGHGALVQSTDVTDGLMSALVTTAAGLSVAIPCYIGFNILVIRIDRLVLDMERVASEMTAFLDENRATIGTGNNHVPSETGK